MKTTRFLLAAGFLLAMAVTMSCSSDNENNPETDSSSSNEQNPDSSDSGGGLSSSDDSGLSSSAGGSSSSVDEATSGTINADGIVYKWVKIGTQAWMAENLNGFYGRCYRGEAANCNKYGGLYNLADAKKDCPSGWHVPTRAEWVTLFDYAGADAVKLLKSTKNWNGNGNGTDAYGFSALPGGFSTNGSNFSSMYYSGLWWTTTENTVNSGSYIYVSMDYENNRNLSYYPGTHLLSVRCVRDN